jgi:two-component system chemotaxis sensor kinase CheA
VTPLSLASLEALMVEVDGSVVAIPFDAVRRLIKVASGDISRTLTGASVIHDQAAIPFLALASALYGVPSPAGSWPVVVVAGAGGLAAVGVDRLRGSERVVVRPLPESTPVRAIVAGAALDAEGNPQLVLDPDGLVAEAQKGGGDFEQAQVRRSVLVVDDSLTTRMLERSILESAGHEVELATSGEEGLECARRNRHALFLVDVEMPGMDGFTFVESIRRDPVLHDTPAILVTSRDAPEDCQRGLDVGAQGYVIKSQFDQAALLAMIGELVS